MKALNVNNSLITSAALLFLFVASSCTVKMARPTSNISTEYSRELKKKEIDLILVPQVKRGPAHIRYRQVDHFHFHVAQKNSPYKNELTINPLMHNAKMTGEVYKNGKLLRTFFAKKNAPTVLNKSKTTWTPSRSKLGLLVPYVEAGEELVITTSYEWMDVRWQRPVFMQEVEETNNTVMNVDVPYGTSMHFQAADMGQAITFVPSDSAQENPLWADENGKSGPGTRYTFEKHFTPNNHSMDPAKRLQVFFSFEPPKQKENMTLFDTWEKVSSYLYERIDRFDFPSAFVKESTEKTVEDADTQVKKIVQIIDFLNREIEMREDDASYEDQLAQTASQTLAKKFGSSLDTVILAKAMLTSQEINSDLVAVSQPNLNPHLENFYSPALFSAVVLVFNIDDLSYYFIPGRPLELATPIPSILQGQNALMIRQSQGQFFSIPFQPAEANQTRYNLELTMSEQGLIRGEYRLELTGAKADYAEKFTSDDQNKVRDTASLQNIILGANNPLRWQSFSLTKSNDKSRPQLVIEGQLIPQLLIKSGKQKFSFRADNILHPITRLISQLSQENVSSINRVDATLKLPDQYDVDSLPTNYSLEKDRVQSRFFIGCDENEIKFEAIAVVSLPIKTEIFANEPQTLENLLNFGKQNLEIAKEISIAEESAGDKNEEIPPTDS